MFNLNKPLELPPQLQWKFAHEPELLAWTIRARNYSTFVANCMFIVVAMLLVGVAYAMYSVYEGMAQPWRTLSCVFFYAVILSVTSSMTHQRINCAYRFTQAGMEHCEWKDFPKWALKFLKWLTVITAVFFVFMATIDPIFLLGALIGPGGMSLTYLSMANSKSYQEMQTQYHHYAFEWGDFKQLAIVTNREIVDFKYCITQDGSGDVINGGVNIFCKSKQKEMVAHLIRGYLSPDVPFIKVRADVPQY